MGSRNLQHNPYWQPDDLGSPMPDSQHAVSVALPRWRDVIAYEENDPNCRVALKTTYPRFGIHPLLQCLTTNLVEQYGQTGDDAWLYPCQEAASQAQRHCVSDPANKDGRAHLVEAGDLTCLITAGSCSIAAKNFWQHTGLGASSRLAAIALELEPKPSPAKGIAAKKLLEQRIAAAYNCRPDYISLHPSGMAALHHALTAIRQRRPGHPTLQLGFPYVDVLKLPRVVHSGSELLLDMHPESLTMALDNLQPSAVIVELPSNPLLQCVNLAQVSELSRARGIPVIADDTIGSAINIDPLPLVDLVFTSLTKSFAGCGDVMAGSLLLSPHSPWKEELQANLSDVPVVPLAHADAIVLERASRDWRDRVKRQNHSCKILAQRLQQHPAVTLVHHPSTSPGFRSLMRPGAGYGCLLSFELHGGMVAATHVYDCLPLNKGPSLGTNFSLLCPYVLLAHYGELDWAERCGVPSNLLRLSVGLEDPEDLWERLKLGLGQRT
ncbi:PLP-dependent transferase [cyanobiont of Ornithocercus magnificus]|nr:PLP-dependent transferase [cyanobiont of Ornithocercus magnificus]